MEKKIPPYKNKVNYKSMINTKPMPNSDRVKGPIP